MSNSANFIDLFDIIGPVMIGPSSSHTAGAAKIGYSAYQILGEVPDKIEIKLYNSFSDTGGGHKTDLAVLGGCLGIKPDDEQLICAGQVAQDSNVKYIIKWGYHSTDFHPNTATIKLYKGKKQVSLVGYSIGGGRISIPKVTTKNIDQDKLAKVPTSAGSHQEKETYFSFKEIINQANTGRQMLKLVLEKQAEATGLSKQEILQEFSRRWQIMVQSINQGIKNRDRSDDGLSGGDSFRMRLSKLRILSRVIENGVIYSIGVAENNAKMGRIVAAPTAGASGIVPGVLRSMQEHFQFSDEKMAEALIIAAAIGAVAANQVELAGAVAGCQAEIGVAGAMTAGAGAYLLGGNTGKIESAASLVQANLLGLTCDPVGGKVEVPCILRNGMVASMVFAAIELSGDNVKYGIPYDEVAGVMKRVGQAMHPKFKETSQGGLAQTHTALSVCSSCNACDGCG